MIKRILFLFALGLATATAAPSPVGNWADGKGFSLSLAPTGAATSSIVAHGINIKMVGRWTIIDKGKWVGTLNFVGKISSFVRNGKDVTPATSDVSMLINVCPNGKDLAWVKGGDWRDKNNDWCDLHGGKGDGSGENPVFHRLE